jgi:malyl-CoA/(S)-citramalyl-CoA lyase
VLEAMDKAQKEGQGAASLDGRLIDIASIRQAEALVRQADLIERAEQSQKSRLATARA